MTMPERTFPVVADGTITANKDPDEALDYTLDWSGRLDNTVSPPEYIVDSQWLVPAGLTVYEGLQSFGGGLSTTIWFSEGDIGRTYYVVNRITTSYDRIFDQTITIVMVNR